MVGPTDSLLAGLTTEGAKLVNPDYVVGIQANWWFLIASTVLITVLGTIITEKIVEPRLGKYNGDVTVDESEMTISKSEQRGLRFAGIATLLTVLGFVALVAPANGLLRGTEPGVQGILNSPFMNSMVVVIALVFAIAGIAYGCGAKVVKNDKDVMNLMGKSMASMGSYIVFSCHNQFFNNDSNLANHVIIVNLRRPFYSYRLHSCTTFLSAHLSYTFLFPGFFGFLFTCISDILNIFHNLIRAIASMVHFLPFIHFG